ncbi:11174_t:CDS:1, partial [Gigaspora rosea]
KALIKSQQNSSKRAGALTPRKRKSTSVEMGKSKNKRAKTQEADPKKEVEVCASHTTEEVETGTAEQDPVLNSNLNLNHQSVDGMEVLEHGSVENETVDMISANEASSDTRSTTEIPPDSETITGTEGNLLKRFPKNQMICMKCK